MKYTSFHESRFETQVNNALISVKRILDATRNPRLVADQQDHSYDDKYAMAALLTNTALVSASNVLERLGMTLDHLTTMTEWVSAPNNKSVTLRFEAIQTCKFMQEREVPFVQGSTHTKVEIEKQSSSGGGGFFRGGNKSERHSLKSKVTTMVKEYHWKVRINYKIMAFAGASPDDGDGQVTWQSRDASTILVIKGTEKVPFLNVFKHPPIEVDLTWFCQQLKISKDVDDSKQMAQFVIDRSDPDQCKTPRRNPQIQKAMETFSDLSFFAQKLRQFLLIKVEREIIGRHCPVTPETEQKAKLTNITTRSLYNPILPLMENTAASQRQQQQAQSRNHNSHNNKTSLVSLSYAANAPLLSLSDMEKFLGEQIRTVEETISGFDKDYLPKGDGENLISTAEAALVLLASHLEQLAFQYEDSVDYIEHLLKQQLIAAIGREVHSKDFDEFMKFYHQHKLYGPAYAPVPFCFAIRRPGYYPDGILSIETTTRSFQEPPPPPGDAVVEAPPQPIDTFVRRIPASTDGSTPPIHVPLNAATTVQITGDRYLHGWIQHRFQEGPPSSQLNSNTNTNTPYQRTYQLAARARQFSCFMVLVGTMAGPDRFEPQSAIILQNKDEVLIPLLLEELPTAKEFKDAISSLSPEQQQFARAFREMQLESSVFGVCVVQLKPQLESLLGLPSGALTKEMQLTQDLLSLFIEYQIPSDLLSYDGDPLERDRTKKVALVKQYTKSVLDVVQGEKDKQLALEKQKAHMALEQYAQENPAFFGDHEMMAMSAVVEEGSIASSIPSTLAIEREMDGSNRTPKLKKKGRSRNAAASVRSSPAALGGGVPMRLDAASFTAASVAYSDVHPDEPGADWSRGPPRGDVPPGPEPGGPFDGPGIPFGPFDGQGTTLSALAGPSGAAALKPPPTQDLSPQDGDAAAESEALDFTKIPKQLDAKFEVHDKDNALRATIIKAMAPWSRKRQENLLAKVGEQQTMYPEEIKSEKDKAFDLLDALTRSGSLPLAFSEIHVIVAVTHSFENDVMGSVVEDNVNPIAKVEKSSLLVASTVHGVPSPHVMLRNTEHVARLQQSFPALFDG